MSQEILGHDVISPRYSNGCLWLFLELLQELAYQKALQRARGEKAFVLHTNAELKHAVC